VLKGGRRRARRWRAWRQGWRRRGLPRGRTPGLPAWPPALGAATRSLRPCSNP